MEIELECKPIPNIINVDDIQYIIEENKRLTELCNKYEEEHNTTFQTWLKDIDRKRKAIEYIKRHRQVYDVDGGKETKLDEFDILSSPKVLLDILEGDEDNEANN